MPMSPYSKSRLPARGLTKQDVSQLSHSGAPAHSWPREHRWALRVLQWGWSGAAPPEYAKSKGAVTHPLLPSRALNGPLCPWCSGFSPPSLGGLWGWEVQRLCWPVRASLGSARGCARLPAAEAPSLSHWSVLALPRCEHLSSSHLPPRGTHFLSCFLLFFFFPGLLQSMGSQSQTQLSDWTIKATRSLSIMLHEWSVFYSMP